MSKKAAEIQERTSKAEDKKINIQPVQFVEEVDDIMKKSDIAQNKCSAKLRKFKQSLEFCAKHEVMSMDEDEDNEQGDPDGYFFKPKNNENPLEKHSFVCKFCEKVFRDRNELQKPLFPA